MLQGKEFWQERYQRILDYEETAESTDEYDRAIAWSEGADIDDSGNIVEIEVPPPKTEKRNGGVSEKRKAEVADQLQLKPIPVDTAESAPEMINGGGLFFGGFKHFYDAYWGTSEVCEPYIMAGALTQMGIMLGRRSCISIGRKPSKRHVIYPNFYAGIIGGTSIARKSSWLRQVRYDLQHIDYDVKVMESIASAEGLIDAMSKDDEGDPINTYEQNAPEGRRTLLLFDEMKSLFGTARRQITSTIIPRLTEAYNCPPALEVNTKHAPIQAHHPVVSILAASTGEWLSDSVTQSDVSGGFINRFAYFLYEYTEPKAEPQDPHFEPLKQWYNVLDRTRSHGDQMRQFVLSDAKHGKSMRKNITNTINGSGRTKITLKPPPLLVRWSTPSRLPLRSPRLPTPLTTIKFRRVLGCMPAGLLNTFHKSTPICSSPSVLARNPKTKR